MMTNKTENNIEFPQLPKDKFGDISCLSLGPGDPDLITLKAWRLLGDAEIIFCPATQSGEKIISRANNILLELGIDPQKIRLFSVPMNKDRSLAQKVYNDVAHEIMQQMQNGKHISFVSEGDSGFYSSVHYISDYLAEKGVYVQHIAGVPAFIACGALAALHIVKQDEALLVIPSDASFEEISKSLSENKTIVLMKLSQQKEVITKLITHLPTIKLHYFENAGIKEKEFYTHNHKEILSREIPYFSILIIRKNN